MDDKNFVTADDLNSFIKNKEPLLMFDLRLEKKYKSGHILGSVHAVCDAKAKDTIMPNIPKNVKIVLVDDEGKTSSEIANMMRSYGLDAYYLQGGIDSWKKDFVTGNTANTVSPDNLWKKISNNNIFLLDVRDNDEFLDFKIPGSVNIPLQNLFESRNISKIPQDKEIVTICPHGNRAMVASFALARNGIKSSVLEGGLAGWSQVLNFTKVTENPTIIQVEKIGKGCLSHMIISDEQAIVIDPLFPAEKYQKIAEQQNFKIIKILDTHQHADHVSSALQLADITGATIYESDYEQWDRKSELLKDGQTVNFGNSILSVIHTPGHTPGSLCYVVDSKYVFTGDILFIESIGRPDLRDKAEEFASELYNSLHNKLFKLPPETVVFPTHHGVTVESVNGVFSTTIEKAKKHDVLKLPKEEFIKTIVDISVPRPMNYQRIIQINKGSAPLRQNEIPDLELGPNRCSISGL